MAGSQMLQKHIKALQAMSKKKIEAGWFESNRYPVGSGGGAGFSVARNARVQNFGATIRHGDTIITIPARPFMQLAWSQFSKSRSDIQAKVAVKMVGGNLSPEQGLGMIGLALEGEIAKAMRDGNWQANSAATLLRKNSTKPLFDSKLMFKSISSKVS